MKMIITEPEVRRAVIEMIASRLGLTIAESDLQPLNKTEGEYEDSRTFQDGYVFEFPPNQGLSK